MSKIVDVKFTLRRHEYEKPFHITGSISSESRNVEVEITLESGIRGYGGLSFVQGERREGGGSSGSRKRGEGHDHRL